MTNYIEAKLISDNPINKLITAIPEESRQELTNHVKAELMSPELVQKLINAIPEDFRQGLGMHTLNELDQNFAQHLSKNNMFKDLYFLNNPLLKLSTIHGFIHGVTYEYGKDFIAQLHSDGKYINDPLLSSSLINCADRINKQEPFIGSCMGLTSVTAYLASKQNIPLVVELFMPSSDLDLKKNTTSGHIRLALRDGTSIENTDPNALNVQSDDKFQYLPLGHLYMATLNNVLGTFYRIYPEIKASGSKETKFQLKQYFINTLDQIVDELPKIEYYHKSTMIETVAAMYVEIQNLNDVSDKSVHEKGLTQAYESIVKLYDSTNKPEYLVDIIRQLSHAPQIQKQILLNCLPFKRFHSKNRTIGAKLPNGKYISLLD